MESTDPKAPLGSPGPKTLFREKLEKIVPDNRWFKLAEMVAWNDLDRVYGPVIGRSMPKPELGTRLVLGALIIKHMDRFTDEEMVAMLAENPYTQCFCGFDSFQTKMPF